MFQLLNNMGPKPLTELFTYKNATTSYELRDSGSALCLPQPRTNSVKKSFMFDGASTWNALPNEIRESNSFRLFEFKLITHIFRWLYKKIANNLFL
jgi:hypothetical protein